MTSSARRGDVADALIQPDLRAHVVRTLEHVSDGVMLVDTDWTVVYANASAAAIAHLPIEDLVGRRVWDAFTGADRPDLEHYREAMRTQEVRVVDVDLGRGDGWFSIRAMPSPSLLTLFFKSIDERHAAAATRAALERALSRQSLTQSVIVRLAETLRVEDVATAVLQLAKRTLDTMLAGVALLTDEGETLRFVSVLPLSSETVAELEPIPRTSSTALADCVRLQRPLYFASRAELLAAYPHQRMTIEAGSRAFCCVPLTVGGRVLGGLSMSWAAERVFSDEDRTFLRMLAAQCAQAIERTQLISRQRDVAEILQQAMLPDALPVVAGVEVSACYLPATTDLTVGGDWYDAFALADGRVALAVGDVSGHGVQAAAMMGQIRNSLRAYLVEGHGPALALTKLDELVERAEHGLFATAIVAIYEPWSGRFVWSNAGHPPVVLRTMTGARFLEGHVGAPIGVHGPEAHVDQELVLEVGDLVIGYTDGLVERRREDLGVSLERLLSVVASSAAKATGDAWCDALVDALLGDRPRVDDICVLVARRV